MRQKRHLSRVRSAACALTSYKSASDWSFRSITSMCFGVSASSGHELAQSGLRCLTKRWLLTVVDYIHSPCGQFFVVAHRKSKDSHERASLNLEYSENRPEFWETGALQEILKTTIASASGHLKIFVIQCYLIGLFFFERL